MARITSLPVLEFATLSVVVVACIVVLLPGGETLVFSYLERQVKKFTESHVHVSQNREIEVDDDRRQAISPLTTDKANELAVADEQWETELVPPFPGSEELTLDLGEDELVHNDDSSLVEDTLSAELSRDRSENRWDIAAESTENWDDTTSELTELNAKLSVEAAEVLAPAELSVDIVPSLVEDKNLANESSDENAFQSNVIHGEILLTDESGSYSEQSQGPIPLVTIDQRSRLQVNDAWDANPLLDLSSDQLKESTALKPLIARKPNQDSGQVVDGRVIRRRPAVSSSDVSPVSRPSAESKTSNTASRSGQATTQTVERFPMSADTMLNFEQNSWRR